MTGQRDYWDSLASYPIDASVIDPNDTKGFKNRYLVGIRNHAVLRAIDSVGSAPVVLDLGCGTGGLSAAVVGGGASVIGLDISKGLLSRTGERGMSDRALFACYDGMAFPVQDSGVDAVVTYVVLNHVIEDEVLDVVLSECWRVLKPGGRMVCIEQVRRHEHLDVRGWKRQRRLSTFVEKFSDAGFLVRSHDVIRYGRFPSTQLIRFGLVADALFPVFSSAERCYGRVWGVPFWGYCDVLFVLDKAHG